MDHRLNILKPTSLFSVWVSKLSMKTGRYILTSRYGGSCSSATVGGRARFKAGEGLKDDCSCDIEAAAAAVAEVVVAVGDEIPPSEDICGSDPFFVCCWV